ncbi:MAG: DNA starvation/stationary phase protection protein [Chthoniobacterales bacterium]
MKKKTSAKKSTKKSPKETLDIGLDQQARDGVVTVLSQVLADAHVLYIKTRNLHWNLVGPRFHSLHEFYEEQYTTLATNIDKIAERIRMVGGESPGSMAEFLEHARLKEQKGGRIDGTKSLELLLADNEAIIRDLREDIEKCEDEFGDVGTADFLTALIQVHEEAAWMLRSYLG